MKMDLSQFKAIPHGALLTKPRNAASTSSFEPPHLGQAYNPATDPNVWGHCDVAFTKPTVAALGQAVSHSNTVYRLTANVFVDHVYILCMNCDQIAVRPEWEGRVSLFSGAQFDACIDATHYSLDHYLKATLSHAGVVSDAVRSQHKTIAVFEEDSSTIGSDTEFNEQDIGDYYNVVTRYPWNVVRLGWRPYTLELNYPQPCSASCACTFQGKRVCTVDAAGCDLRSSDGYVMHSRAFAAFFEQLINWAVVDTRALQSLSHQVLVHPMLSYQNHLDITPERQKELVRLFADSCVVHQPYKQVS